MPKITGIMTAAAAAVLLAISPVAAQESGAGKGSGAEVTQRLDIHQDERLELQESFARMGVTPTTVAFDYEIGATVPETVTLDPVPDEMFAAVPAIEGHTYVGLPDGTVALVDPETRVIVDIF